MIDMYSFDKIYFIIKIFEELNDNQRLKYNRTSIVSELDLFFHWIEKENLERANECLKKLGDNFCVHLSDKGVEFKLKHCKCESHLIKVGKKI